MPTGHKPFNAAMNILVDVDTKIQLAALARCKRVYGFSAIVRSILLNAIPRMIEQLTPSEREVYERVVEIERETFATKTGTMVSEVKIK